MLVQLWVIHKNILVNSSQYHRSDDENFLFQRRPWQRSHQHGWRIWMVFMGFKLRHWHLGKVNYIFQIITTTFQFEHSSYIYCQYQNDKKSKTIKLPQSFIIIIIIISTAVLFHWPQFPNLYGLLRAHRHVECTFPCWDYLCSFPILSHSYSGKQCMYIKSLCISFTRLVLHGRSPKQSCEPNHMQVVWHFDSKNKDLRNKLSDFRYIT